MSRSYSDINAINLDTENTQSVYLDNENNDIFAELGNMLDDYFHVNEKLKIVNLRRAAADKVKNNDDKLNDYLTLTHNELKLLQKINELQTLPVTYELGKTSLFEEALIEFQGGVNATVHQLEEIVGKLFKSPSAAVAKDVILLTKTADSILKFSLDPHNENNIKKLIENTQLVHKKMGTYWRPLKAALTALVGIALILVGVLGLVPSFGGSVALIAGGSALCAASGLSLFKPFASQKARHANELGKEVTEMMAKAKTLLHFDNTRSQQPEPAGNDHSKKRR